MRAGFVFYFCLLAAGGEVVDRIAASVGRQVIAESEVVESIRVAAFLNREPADLGAAARRKAAERLVEQALLRREMEVSHYPLPGLEVGVDGAAGVSDSELAAAGLTREQLRRHLRWQSAVLAFIEYRFKPGVQLTESEVVEYYQARRREWLARKDEKAPELAEVRESIEKALTQEHVDRAVDRWLGEARSQVAIRFREAAR